MLKNKSVDPRIVEFFDNPLNTLHRQYLVLRRFYLDELSAEEVAAEYDLTVYAVYSLAREFKGKLYDSNDGGANLFFQNLKLGRPKQEREPELVDAIVSYRKKDLSIPDIKVLLDSKGYSVTEGYIFRVCDENGFIRLHKRGREEKQEVMERSGYTEVLSAPVAVMLPFIEAEHFSSKGVGILCFLPIIKVYEIDKLIEESLYPGTTQIEKLNSILAVLVLKLSKVERYGHDDGWCMDRGLGLLAGLNVLPKTSWFSTYSDAIEHKDNIAFLKAMNHLLEEHGLLSDSANLDFTAIPYWGDSDPYENNWSGKRGKALISIQAVLAQDPDSGILCYGDTTIKHDNQDDVILEFMDFYYESTKRNINYLVFDSKFTTLGNLGRINSKGIKFVTIQRKSKYLNEKSEQFQDSDWKTVKIEKSNHKSRTVSYCESNTTNKLYGEESLRQIFIKGRSIKPATILTNDFKSDVKDIIRRYSKRWLIETEISSQIQFFHLNRNSSGIVVKVDFDLTMSILAHNLYRILASTLPGYSHCRPETIYDTFLENYGDIDISDDTITVKMNRKRNLPLLRESIPEVNEGYSWLGGKKVVFQANTHS